MGERGTPRLSASQVVAILKRHGFVFAGQSGSHQKWRNPATGKQVIVADHHGRVLPIGTMRAVITGSGIAAEHWINRA